MGLVPDMKQQWRQASVVCFPEHSAMRLDPQRRGKHPHLCQGWTPSPTCKPLNDSCFVHRKPDWPSSLAYLRFSGDSRVIKSYLHSFLPVLGKQKGMILTNLMSILTAPLNPYNQPTSRLHYCFTFPTGHFRSTRNSWFKQEVIFLLQL